MAWDSDRARDVTRVKGPAHAARQTNSGNRRRAAAQSASDASMPPTLLGVRITLDRHGLMDRREPCAFVDTSAGAAAVKLCKVRSKTKGPCANVVVAGELFCQQHLYHKDKVTRPPLPLPFPDPSPCYASTSRLRPSEGRCLCVQPKKGTARNGADEGQSVRRVRLILPRLCSKF